MELRKDYLLERFTYIAEGRKLRPSQYAPSLSRSQEKTCSFCPGNEHLTPPEIGRIKDAKGQWQLRWFANKFPVVLPKANLPLGKKEKFLKKFPARGYHEVIVETPEHKKLLADLDKEEIKTLLKVYQERIEKLSQKKDIQYVVIFKNSGQAGGASLTHSHSQIIALDRWPSLVLKEARASQKPARSAHLPSQAFSTEKITKNRSFCAYCQIISQEAQSPRKAFENESIVAFCPFAPRFNREVWIFPKKHYNNFCQFDEATFEDMSQCLKRILVKLKEIQAPFCYFIHYGTPEHNLHFHIEIIPRLNIRAGFELGTGFYVVTVSPEKAAQFYRK